jgi:hypothetical protein
MVTRLKGFVMNRTKMFVFIAWIAAVLVGAFFNIRLPGATGVSLSVLTLFIPLLGACTSWAGTCLTLSALVGITCIYHGLPLTLGIPTILATLSWSVNNNRSHGTLFMHAANIVVHILIPVTCMYIFISNPVGNPAWAYTLYWLIPAVLWLAQQYNYLSNPVTYALQSTFVAHAVGSIMWLKAGILPTEFWFALIPVVAVERLAMALVMVLAFYAIKSCGSLLVLLAGRNFKFAFKSKI